MWDKHHIYALLLAGATLLLSVTLAPWLARRAMRKRGLPAGNVLGTVIICFVCGNLVPVCLFLLLTGNALCGLALVPVLVLFVLAMKVRATLRLPGMILPVIWGWHVAVLLLCNVIHVAAIAQVNAMNPYDAGNRYRNDLVADIASLRAIGASLLAYQKDSGAFPEDLRQLVDGKYIEGRYLLPAHAEWQTSFPATRPYPCAFTYLLLPASAPAGLPWVWDDPKYHDGEYALILYTGGAVEWVKSEKFQAEVQRAQAWLRTSATQPATVDATSLVNPVP